ncbi:MAG: hypothetical protein KA793_09480 [Bacteroidales bacterium]|nr:hypothetical protein [Bacteroidales bacterium]
MKPVNQSALFGFTRELFSKVLENPSCCNFPGYEAIASDNAWFTRDNVEFVMAYWVEALQPDSVDAWLQGYENQGSQRNKTIALIFAGNIPLVGFHDLLCCMVAGHRVIAKLSSKDRLLPEWYLNCLKQELPEIAHSIEFTGHIVENFDAVIATGSNNSGRYFDYYFSKFPHIIRRNRNSAALLSGAETREELALLANDVFLYFGLGCRSVNMLLVPPDYDFGMLIEVFTEKFGHLLNFGKYANNYDYYRTLFLLNRFEFADCGFFLLRENSQLASPVAVLHFMRYSSGQEAMTFLAEMTESLQCIVSTGHQQGTVLPGSAQKPALNDYSDGIDTLKFLLHL